VEDGPRRAGFLVLAHALALPTRVRWAPATAVRATVRVYRARGDEVVAKRELYRFPGSWIVVRLPWPRQGHSFAARRSAAAPIVDARPRSACRPGSNHHGGTWRVSPPLYVSLPRARRMRFSRGSATLANPRSKHCTPQCSAQGTVWPSLGANRSLRRLV